MIKIKPISWYCWLSLEFIFLGFSFSFLFSESLWRIITTCEYNYCSIAILFKSALIPQFDSLILWSQLIFTHASMDKSKYTRIMYIYVQCYYVCTKRPFMYAGISSNQFKNHSLSIGKFLVSWNPICGCLWRYFSQEIIIVHK